MNNSSTVTPKQYDLAVIGGGPGGYVAAIRAAQLGMKVVVIERENLGGVCLNWGCIPTKALLKSSEVSHLLKHANEFGFQVDGFSFDFDKIIQRSRAVSAQLSGGIAHLMRKNNITVVKGSATLMLGKKIVVKEQSNSNSKIVDELTAKNIILATGSRPKSLPGLETDGERVLNYKDALLPKFFAKNLLIVGSGAIGIEFASFYSNMGSKVAIVEIADKILRPEDDEIASFVQKSFEGQGIEVHLQSKIATMTREKDGVTVVIEKLGAAGAPGTKQAPRKFDAVIVAVGIDANIEGLGLEKTKVKVDRGHIVTNEWSETAEPGVYAIGDVAGPPWLAHKASHEGVICVERIAGVKGVKPLNVNKIPGCVYSMPQVASIGMTEQQAKVAGLKVRVGKFSFAANGKALAIGELNGFVKTIFDDKTGELLGAHMVGAEVTEMIQGYVIAMTLEATEEDLMHTVFPHPTLSEMMHESVLQAYGKALHI